MGPLAGADDTGYEGGMEVEPAAPIDAALGGM